MIQSLVVIDRKRTIWAETERWGEHKVEASRGVKSSVGWRGESS